ncbi:unnamed protein product [Caenorhabditis auriculariae]|uniref:Vacuolar protein sorting-associated protein 54 n=1 Tax=Caenorhabditis auriculariae TaxID=2777116 RepID=A0A8S1HCS8_9PELO|nr:unnamed protein product [Caenorhabditis auriculariae]
MSTFEVNFTQNLSAVLADPHRSRTETNTFFTRHWGDAFVPQTTVLPSKKVPVVGPNAFHDYSTTTGEAYRRYRTVRRALRLSRESTGDEKQDADDLPMIFIDPRFALSDAGTFSSIFTVPPSGGVDVLRETISGRTLVPATPTDLSGAKKPGTFRDYDSLHCRLELMHDVVDGRLASKLVSKTDSFWKVVRSYSGLQEQLARAMESVKSVRGDLKEVDDLICERSKKIVRMFQVTERKRKLLAKLNDIACLREAQSTVQMMLSQGDFPKAIECIETSLDVLSGELNGVTCFRHLSSQLRELYDMIGRMMHEEFASIIQREFGVKPDADTLIQSEGELTAVLLGLMRMRKYAFIGVLREEVQEGVKNIMRQVVKNQIISSGLDLSQFDPSLTQLGDPVRRLKHFDYLTTVRLVMEEMFDFCKRLQALQELLLEVADRAHPQESGRGKSAKETSQRSFDELAIPVPNKTPSEETISDEEESQEERAGRSLSGASSSFTIPASSASATVLMSIDVRSESYLRLILPLMAEYGHQCAQQRISRLLIARAKNAAVTESTSPSELADVLHLVREYQNKCDSQGWYSTQSARGGHLSRAASKISVDYIDKFHVSRKSAMGKALDTEMWKAAEVTPTMQTALSEAWTAARLRVPPEGVSFSAMSSRASSSATLDSQAIPAQTLTIDGEPFVVVGSSCHLSFKIGCHGPLNCSRMFNSRSCQLILGAGALQLVGLRTISVRNLALAARSLQLVTKFIPVVAAEMDAALRDDRKNLLRHFKQVETDYADHVGEITSKLVSVIDHYTSNCLGMWEVKGTVPSPEFQQICKHMTKFHNGLVGIMPPKEIRALFERVHENFKVNLKEQLTALGVTPHDPLKLGYVTQNYMFYQQSINLMESCREMDLESLNEILFD